MLNQNCVLYYIDVVLGRGRLAAKWLTHSLCDIVLCDHYFLEINEMFNSTFNMFFNNYPKLMTIEFLRPYIICPLKTGS